MLYHVTTCKAGEPAYYETRARGTVEVFHDSKKYVYRKPSSLRQFKIELFSAFGDRCQCKVEGRYPSYRIETWA